MDKTSLFEKVSDWDLEASLDSSSLNKLFQCHLCQCPTILDSACYSEVLQLSAEHMKAFNSILFVSLVSPSLLKLGWLIRIY